MRLQRALHTHTHPMAGPDAATPRAPETRAAAAAAERLAALEAAHVERIEQDAELYAVLAPQELGQAQIDRDAVRAALCNLTGDVLTALYARM